MSMSIGKNTASGKILTSYVERIERLRAEKKELSAEETAVLAEAKAQGFTPARIRDVVKRRAMKPHDLQEAQAELDMYMHAMGMDMEAPLFRSVSLMNVDTAAREQVIDAFKLLVPQGGEVIVKPGGEPVRLWRDDKGEVHWEDYVEPEAAPKPQPGSSTAKPEKPPVPDVTEDGAREMGVDAAKDNVPVIKNPFPFGDKRRARWDEGWRMGNGGDGMGPDTDRDDDEGGE